jgi:DNA polymerase III epsilon subunit-like protein
MTAHHLERERFPDGRLGYHCVLCLQGWVRKPSSRCPGVPAYFSWDEATSAGLRTQTQWKAQRRRVLADARPAAVFQTQHDWYALYAEAQTTPMREASPAQKAVLEKGRQTQRTCRRCGRAYESTADLNRRRICYNCILDARARREAARDAEARKEATAWARELLDAADWVILDTETTSLDEPEILEVAILSASGEILLDTLVRPITPIEDGARAVHGISDEDLASATQWPAVYPQLVEALAGRRVLAYNASFDADAIVTTCRLHGLEAGEIHWLDLMEPYSNWCGEWSDYHKGYRWQRLPGGHRAVDDCRVALQLLQDMAQTMAAPTRDQIVT